MPILEESLIELWKRYDWPGNVRELRNEVERLVIAADDHSVLRASDSRLYQSGSAPQGVQPSPQETLPPQASTGHSAGIRPLAHERREVLIAALKERGRMYQKDISQVLRCSPGTTRSLVRSLLAEGVLQPIDTSQNLRTSYYILAEHASCSITKAGSWGLLG